MAEPLSRSEIEERLGELPGWSLDGGRLTRAYRLDSHFAATSLVIHVAQIQEELNHHSELTLGYNTVSLSVVGLSVVATGPSTPAPGSRSRRRR